MKTIQIKSLAVAIAMLTTSSLGFAQESDTHAMDHSRVSIEKVEQAINSEQASTEQAINTEQAMKNEQIENKDQKTGVGQKFKDTSITASVKTKLIGSDIKARDINVDTTNNVVTLKGSVANEAQKALAESIAAQTKNVAGVISELTIHQNTVAK